MTPLDDTTTKNCVTITPYSQEYDLTALQTFCYHLFLKDRRLVSEMADKKQNRSSIFIFQNTFLKKNVFLSLGTEIW